MNEQEIYERVTAAEQSIKSAHHRIDEVAKSSKCISDILAELKYMRRDLNSLIERVTTVEARPARRVDLIINAVLTAVIAAAVNIAFRI